VIISVLLLLLLLLFFFVQEISKPCRWNSPIFRRRANADLARCRMKIRWYNGEGMCWLWHILFYIEFSANRLYDKAILIALTHHPNAVLNMKRVRMSSTGWVWSTKQPNLIACPLQTAPLQAILSIMAVDVMSFWHFPLVSLQMCRNS